MRRPPKFAASFLRRFGPANDALAGDLREAYVTGTSRRWYWRQTLSAIVGGVRQDIRQDIMLTLCGLYIGVASYHLVLLPVYSIRVAANHFLSPIVPGWPRETQLLWDTPVLFGAYLLIGWLTARLIPRHRVPSLLMLIAYKALLEFPWFAVTAFQGMSLVVFTRYVVVEVGMLLIFATGTLIGGTGLGTLDRVRR
jgi:hypothetical protein